MKITLKLLPVLLLITAGGLEASQRPTGYGKDPSKIINARKSFGLKRSGYSLPKEAPATPEQMADMLKHEQKMMGLSDDQIMRLVAVQFFVDKVFGAEKIKTRFEELKNLQFNDDSRQEVMERIKKEIQFKGKSFEKFIQSDLYETFGEFLAMKFKDSKFKVKVRKHLLKMYNEYLGKSALMGHQIVEDYLNKIHTIKVNLYEFYKKSYMQQSIVHMLFYIASMMEVKSVLNHEWQLTQAKKFYDKVYEEIQFKLIKPVTTEEQSKERLKLQDQETKLDRLIDSGFFRAAKAKFAKLPGFSKMAPAEKKEKELAEARLEFFLNDKDFKNDFIDYLAGEFNDLDREVQLFITVPKMKRAGPSMYKKNTQREEIAAAHLFKYYNWATQEALDIFGLKPMSGTTKALLGVAAAAGTVGIAAALYSTTPEARKKFVASVDAQLRNTASNWEKSIREFAGRTFEAGKKKIASLTAGAGRIIEAGKKSAQEFASNVRSRIPSRR